MNMQLSKVVFPLVMSLALGACVHVNNSLYSLSDQKEDKVAAAKTNTQLGIAYLREGDYSLAKQKLDRAMKENPHDAGVHSAMAMLYDRLGDEKLADAEFREALRLAPTDPDLLNNYAVYLCRNGHTDEGVKRFEEAAHNAFYQTPEAAWTNAGVCLRSARRDSEARKRFLMALNLRPNFAEAAFQLSDLEFQLGNLPAARQELESFLGHFPETPDLLLLAVRVTRAQNDPVAAERYSRKLRLDFPASDQTRVLAELDHKPG